MGRTFDELLAWAARVGQVAIEATEQARASWAETAAAESTSTILDDPPLEEAAERALLRQFTAEEIADYLGVPVEYVMRAAYERAGFKEQPVDDTLRSWFRVLIA